MQSQFEVAYGCLSHHVHELGKEIQAGNFGKAHTHAVELKEHAHLLMQRLWAATHISGNGPSPRVTSSTLGEKAGLGNPEDFRGGFV